MINKKNAMCLAMAFLSIFANRLVGLSGRRGGGASRARHALIWISLGGGLSRRITRRAACWGGGVGAGASA